MSNSFFGCAVQAKEGRRDGTHSIQFSWKLICDPLMKSSSFGIKLNVQRYLSLLEFLLSPWGKRVTDWCKFLPEPPHVPSICILQRTDTVSAPRYFILRPLKSCWETGVREMVPGIRVLGWEGDLVSRDVELCLQTKIIQPHMTIGELIRERWIK